MNKRRKGYFTVEASLIMPIVLFLYLLIIMAALLFYCRCAISQDNYLLAMRSSRFTSAQEGYGEVIYGETESFPVQEYVAERLSRKRPYYPFYGTGEGGCRITENEVTVWTKGKGNPAEIKKKAARWNPVAIIREGRRTDA